MGRKAASYALVVVAIVFATICASTAGDSSRAKQPFDFWCALAVTGVAGYWSVGLSRPDSRRAHGLLLLVLGGLVVVTVGTMVPVFESAKAAASKTTCFSNAKLLANQLLQYSSSYDDTYPPTSVWCSASTKYAYGPRSHCQDCKAPYDFAMNSGLAKIPESKVTDPTQTVMLFEADAYGPNAAGGREWFAPRHFGRGTVAFSDGHERQIRPGEGVWSP